MKILAIIGAFVGIGLLFALYLFKVRNRICPCSLCKAARNKQREEESKKNHWQMVC